MATSHPWLDALDVYFAPGALLQRSSKASPGRLLLLLVLSMWAVYMINRMVYQTVYDSEYQVIVSRAASQGGLVSEEVSALRPTFDRIAIATWPLGLIFRVAILSLALWGVGRVCQVAMDADTAFLLGVCGCYPLLIEQLVYAFQGFAEPSREWSSFLEASIGLGRPLAGHDMSKEVATLLGDATLFAAWGIALLYLGLRKRTDATPTRAIIIAAASYLATSIARTMAV